MLDKGNDLDWFNSGQIITLAAVAVVGFAIFLVWELTEEHPVVDLALFGRRNFLFGSTSLSLAYGLFFGNVVLVPMWLQQYMGYTAFVAGMAVAPVGLLAIILSPIVGKNVAKVDPRLLATVAFAGFGLVMWMRSNFTTQADFDSILVPTVLQGGAIAFFFIPLSAITLNGLTPDRIPSASGLSNFVCITAGAMGTSTVSTIWENRATLHHLHMIENISNNNAPATETLSALQGMGMSFDQAAAQVTRLIDQQAFTRAADDVYLASAWLFLSLIPIIWLAKPKKMSAPVDAGGAH
jgi:DHA2 family multidrug resistance protein